MWGGVAQRIEYIAPPADSTSTHALVSVSKKRGAVDMHGTYLLACWPVIKAVSTHRAVRETAGTHLEVWRTELRANSRI